MKTDIWMPWYIKDYLADTSRLSTIEHGAYMLLIGDYWINGELPDNNDILLQVTKLPKENLQVISGLLSRFFTFNEITKSWKSKRIDEELAKAKKRKENAVANGKKGGRPEKEKPRNNPEVNPNPNPEKSSSPAPASSPIPITSNNNPSDFVAGLPIEWQPILTLWLEYKKERRQSYRSDKSLECCYKNLIGLSGNSPEVAEKIIQQSIANNWSGLFKLSGGVSPKNKAEESTDNARKYIESLNI